MNDENQKLKQELEDLETQKTIKKMKRKRKIGKIIGNIIMTIIFLFLVFEAAMGIINMQRISDEKEPIWYLSTTTTETDLKTETTYNLGLYKIVKTDTSKKTTTSLRPFFMGD